MARSTAASSARSPTPRWESRIGADWPRESRSRASISESISSGRCGATRSARTAKAIHSGRTITYYVCDVVRADGKLVAHATSTIMTLTGEAAKGR